MSVNDIIEKITNDSAATAEEIVAEARGRASDRLDEATALADDLLRARLDKAEQQADAVRVRALALARKMIERRAAHSANAHHDHIVDHRCPRRLSLALPSLRPRYSPRTVYPPFSPVKKNPRKNPLTRERPTR